MANRAARRKEKRNLSENVVVDNQEEFISSAAKISVVVTGVFVLFCVIAVLLKGGIDFSSDTDNKDDDDNNETITIQYDEILAGETFNMPYQEYYVIFFNYEDKSTSVYEAIISNFKKVNADAKIFKVDLNKGFNTPYTSETSNHNVSTSDELKISGPTLIKVKDGKNVTYVEGKDSIKEILK